MADKNNKNSAFSLEHLLNKERVLRIFPLYFIENKRNKIRIYNIRIRIATWNIRSLFMTEKLANVEKISKINLDVLGLSEVKWPGAGIWKTNKETIYYSERSDANHKYGTAVLVTNEVTKSVEFVSLNDKVMLLKI